MHRTRLSIPTLVVLARFLYTFCESEYLMIQCGQIQMLPVLPEHRHWLLSSIVSDFLRETYTVVCSRTRRRDGFSLSKLHVTVEHAE